MTLCGICTLGCQKPKYSKAIPLNLAVACASLCLGNVKISGGVTNLSDLLDPAKEKKSSWTSRMGCNILDATRITLEFPDWRNTSYGKIDPSIRIS